MSKLTFIDQVKNLNGVLETLQDFVKTTTEYEDEASEIRTVVDNDLEQSMEFVSKLSEIVYGACVLAVYGGEDWTSEDWEDRDKSNFGADGYDYLDKYVAGGIELKDYFGTEDFYEIYDKYFKNNIRPKNKDN